MKTQFSINLAGEIRVDLFAGGGGATMGQEMGTGMPVDIAINHNPDAISMHKRNHSSAEHYITDVYDVCPRLATRGRPVTHLHASPECTHQWDHFFNCGNRPTTQPEREPVLLTAVAIVRKRDDEMRLDWLLEGGICELKPGQYLIVADQEVTDDNGDGEVYRHPGEQSQ